VRELEAQVKELQSELAEQDAALAAAAAAATAAAAEEERARGRADTAVVAKLQGCADELQRQVQSDAAAHAKGTATLQRQCEELRAQIAWERQQAVAEVRACVFACAGVGWGMGMGLVCAHA